MPITYKYVSTSELENLAIRLRGQPAHEGTLRRVEKELRKRYNRGEQATSND